MSIEAIKALIVGLILASLLAGAWHIGDALQENKQMRDEVKGLTDRVDKVEQANKLQDELFVKREELQNELRGRVADVTVRIKQEASRDPQLRAYLDTRIPDGLRRQILAGQAGASAERQGADAAHEDRGQARK